MTLRALVPVILVAALVGCGPKRPPNVATPGGLASPSPRPSAAPPSASYGTQGDAGGADVQSIRDESVNGEDFSVNDASGENGPLADVLFDYDQAALSNEGRAIAEKHALWLQNHRTASVTIEGHTDERGTAEYNLALGEQRARAVLDYLRSLGVSADRMKTVSYGKEKPLDPAHNESAWGRNRRAHFLVSK